jgi:hypothetical protein
MVAQGADVVDDSRAGGDRGLGHGGLVGVHRDERAELPRAALDQREDSLELLLRRHRGPVGAG